MINVTVKITHKGKAGALDLDLSEVKEFYFGTGEEAVEFGLEINADPTCKIVGWKEIRSGSVNAARADLQMAKDILAASF